MADPLQKVNPTDALRFRADSFNAFVDAAKWVRTQMRGQGDSVPEIPELTPALLVFVKNTTGSTILENAPVVWDGTTPISPVTATQNANRQPVFGLAAPASNTDPVLITQAPIETDKIGIAAVAGVTVAQVSVSDASHRFARPIAGNTLTLESATSGPVRILGPYATGNEPRLVLILNTASASSDLTVYLVDQNWATLSSQPSVTSLKFIQTNGFRNASRGFLSNAIVIGLDSADRANMGGVSLTDQDWAGGKSSNKYFRVYNGGGPPPLGQPVTGPNGGFYAGNALIFLANVFGFEGTIGQGGAGFTPNLPSLTSGGGVSVTIPTATFGQQGVGGITVTSDTSFNPSDGTTIWIMTSNISGSPAGLNGNGIIVGGGRWAYLNPSDHKVYVGQTGSANGLVFKAGLWVGVTNLNINGGGF